MKRRSIFFLVTASLIVSLLTVSHAGAQNPVPFKLTGTATWDNLLNAFNPAVGATFNDGAGDASHLGEFSATATLISLDFPNANGDFPVIGTVELIAASGARLNATFDGILNAFTGSGTADFEFMGGDGRFTGATGGGTLEAFFDLSNGLENVPMVVTWNGVIDY